MPETNGRGSDSKTRKDFRQDPGQESGQELRISRRKKTVFLLITVVFSVTVCLALAELAVRYWHLKIDRNSHMDPGLLVYDPFLGWRLEKNWSGRHLHHDFQVRYTTNRFGFRGRFPEAGTDSERTVAVVGDSFTFCLGVNDEETLVENLNRMARGEVRFMNFGVPGFSTDQEYLLLREQVIHFSPDEILLVVYLGNDLFDNQLAFPLQVNYGKPYFSLDKGTIELKNSPVPRKEKSALQSRRDLTALGIGSALEDESFLFRHLGRFELYRLIHAALPVPLTGSVPNPEFLDPGVDLFEAILDRMAAICDSRKIDFSLVLMPGKAYVEAPRTSSAGLQEYFRQKILVLCQSNNWKVIDLASALKSLYLREKIGLFHPNEGHLNARGLAKAATVIEEQL